MPHFGECGDGRNKPSKISRARTIPDITGQDSAEFSRARTIPDISGHANQTMGSPIRCEFWDGETG
jgi:hypothetical protein